MSRRPSHGLIKSWVELFGDSPADRFTDQGTKEGRAMSYSQKEAVERKRRIAAARTWTGTAGKPDQGFSEWYSDSGQDLSGVSHADAYEAWLTSSARIEWWAERQGIYVGRGFARWYLAEGRTDSFAAAYEVYRAMLHAEIEADRKRRTGA